MYGKILNNSELEGLSLIAATTGLNTEESRSLIDCIKEIKNELNMWAITKHDIARIDSIRERLS